MGCPSESKRLQKTVDVAIPARATAGENKRRMCVYRLNDDPTVYYVKVTGGFQSASVSATYGLNDITGATTNWFGGLNNKLVTIALVTITKPTSNCFGGLNNELVTITNMGEISLSCPVKRIHSKQHVVFGWNDDCTATPARIGDLKFRVRHGALIVEPGQTKYQHYFGLVHVSYQTTDGEIIKLQQSGKGLNGGRIAIIRLQFDEGCEFVPVLLDDSVPSYASHAEAGCCPCQPDASGGG